MKSTKFWIVAVSALFAVSAVAAYLLMNSFAGGTTANIYLDGECVRSIDLSSVTEDFEFTVTGGYENTIRVSAGKICVAHADCPDKVCVSQGWISNGVAPVVCLPNRLVIQIEDEPGADSGYDAIVK